MKAKSLLLFVLIVCGHAVVAFGQQFSCQTSNKLVCELPVSSSTVEASVIGSGAALLSTSAAAKIAGGINSSIGTQLSQLAIPSASVGTVSLQQAGNPFGVPFDNLGPILTDRPDTVGKHRLFAGFSYQRFNFNAINGIDLNQFPVGYVQPNTQTGQIIYGSEIANVDFHLNQYVAQATFGLFRQTDVTVVVPFNDVSLNVSTSNFKTFLFDPTPTGGQYVNESPTGKLAQPVSTSGSANGIGDVIITVKQLLLGQEGRPPAIAVGGDLRLPTGDALNYLGSGAYGFNLHGLFEYRWKVSPHVKLGYQWNTNSKLVNIFNAPSTPNQLPGGVQYAVGADYRVIRQLTIAADLLGSQYVNTQTLSKFSQTLPAIAGQTGTPVQPATLPSIVSNNDTYASANFSVGLKYHPHKNWLFYGNVLVPINNVGLRSDPVPLVGVSFIR